MYCPLCKNIVAYIGNNTHEARGCVLGICNSLAAEISHLQETQTQHKKHLTQPTQATP